jgi:hypothetical protein
MCGSSAIGTPDPVTQVAGDSAVRWQFDTGG